MKGMSIIIVTLFVVILVGCAATKKGKSQGIEGFVYTVTGNQMPSPDIKPAPPKGTKTNLYIYELTSMSQVVQDKEPTFYKSINSSLVKMIETDEKGYFKTNLAPGTYSLFVKVDQLFYANLFDNKNSINPVVVDSGKLTKVVFNINYKAVY